MLAVETVDLLLVLSESELESVLLGEEHGLSGGICDEVLVVGDEGSNDVGVWSLNVSCKVPLRETRCLSSLSKHNSACGGGPEMGLE